MFDKQSFKKSLLVGASAFVMGGMVASVANATALPDADTTAGAAEGYTIGAGGDSLSAGNTVKSHATPTADLVDVGAGSGDLTVAGKLQGEGDGGTAGLDTIDITADNATFDINVSDGGTITSDGVNGALAINVDNTMGTLTNLGTVSTSANDAIVISIDTAEAMTIVNGNSAGTDTGTISAHGTGSAIKVEGTLTGSITNYTGSSILSAGDSTSGVIDIDGAITGAISNSGTIKTNAGGIAIEIGANITEGLTNTSTGTISATTGDAIQVSGAFTDADQGLNNAGTISVTTGLALDVNATITLLTNTGTITSTGGQGIDIANATGITTFNNTKGLITDTTTGTAIKFAGTSTTALTNTGTISTGGAGIAIDIDGAVTGGITNTGGLITSAGGVTIDDDGGLSTGISNTGTISSTSGNVNAISIANGIATSISNTGGTISATGSAGTIDYVGTSAAGITNSGTITNTGTGFAVDVGTELTGASGVITNNAGGLIQAAANDAMNIADIDGTITNAGTIKSVSGNNSAIEIVVFTGANLTSDTYINNSGLITAAGTAATIVFGDAANGSQDKIVNTGTISNTSTGGVIDLALSNDAADDLIITNTGAITASSATNSAILGSGGTDTLNWNGGSITGTIDLGSETGDTINIGDESTDSITSGGAISGISQLEVKNGTFNLGHTVTLTNATEADEDVILDVNTTTNVTTDVTITAGDVDVNGVLDIAAGKTLTLTADTNNTLDFDDTGTLSTNLTKISTADHGKIDANNAAGTLNIVTGATFDFNVAAVEHIVAGTLTDLVAADVITIDGAAYTDTLLKNAVTITDDSYVLAFAISDDSDATGIDIAVTRENTYDDASTLVNESAVGAALETIALSGDSTIDTLNATLDSQTSARAVEQILETLDPDVSGMTSAAIMSAVDSGLDNVGKRLDQVAGISGSSVVTGGSAYNSGVWGEFFGTSADQDWRKGVNGYQADTLGFGVGADTAINDQVRLGVGLAYAATEAEGEFNNETDIDSYQIAGYGTYDLGQWYTDGLVAFTHNKLETTRNIAAGAGGGQAKGDFDAQQYTVKVGAGYKLNVEGGLNVTPVASLKYDYVAFDKYTETGTLPLTVDNDDINSLKSDIGVKLNYPIVAGSVTYIPEISTSWTYDFVGDEQEAKNNFVGAASTQFTSKGAKVAQNALNVGLGLDVLAQDNVTVSFDYDWTTKEDYDSHSGGVKARFAF